MNLVSLRIITGDVPAMVAFYEQATGIRATWFTPNFAELGTASGTLAIASTRTINADPRSSSSSWPMTSTRSSED